MALSTRERGAPSRAGAAYATLISAVAAMGGFLFGYDTAAVNGTIGALERHFRADPSRLGFAVASALLGSAVGSLIAGRAADRVGRVRVMQVTAALSAVSSLGSGIAESLWSFSTWRFLGGIAVGSAASSRRRTSRKWHRRASAGGWGRSSSWGSWSGSSWRSPSTT